jgi:hypothetical protein
MFLYISYNPLLLETSTHKNIQQIKYKKSTTIIGIEIDTTKRNITNYIIEKL